MSSADLKKFLHADARLIPLDQAKRILRQMLADDSGKTIAVLSRKKDGSIRRWVIGPKHGRALIKGEKPAPALPPNFVRVFDLSVAQTRDIKGRLQKAGDDGWRTLNLDGLIAVRRGQVEYVVSPEATT